MRDHRRKKPLYRKVNTQARGVPHDHGGNFRDDRNSAAEARAEIPLTSMHGQKRRGLDYTPLFRFLLSKVGEPWDDVFGEAKSRLDRTDPIFWLVARTEAERLDVVRIGESTYFSGLFVDKDGVLQIVNPSLRAENMRPSCQCCTHTFNGVPFGSSLPTNPAVKNSSPA